jgi:hypothetical protein
MQTGLEHLLCVCYFAAAVSDRHYLLHLLPSIRSAQHEVHESDRSGYGSEDNARVILIESDAVVPQYSRRKLVIAPAMMISFKPLRMHNIGSSCRSSRFTFPGSGLDCRTAEPEGAQPCMSIQAPSCMC